MDDLDFSAKAPTPAQTAVAARSAVQATAQSPLYNPAIAFDFFRSTGTAEAFKGGAPIFAENEKAGGLFSKSARMYLLFEGEVGLMVKNQFFGVIKKGDIFGELAVIAGLPRSATAIAKADSKVLSLDEKQFHAALRKTPEFALMLMGIMIGRLRQSITKLGPRAAGAGPASRGAALDAKMLAELATLLGDEAINSAEAGKVVMSAGAAGALMYVVAAGRVAITVNNNVVERVVPGGIFGEMALVDRAARAATAVAEVDSRLIGIGRNAFLDLVKTNPAFGASLLKSIAERMQYLAAQLTKA
jgi:CRP-like cAMP-binding protein